MKIYKYELIGQTTIIGMPKGAQILTVQKQGNNTCVWALVDPEESTEDITFHIVGTGNPADHVNDLLYVGTVQQAGGALIWHVFVDGITIERG